ncbi:hypothetical protein ABK040_014822 [Willaertia magna]
MKTLLEHLFTEETLSEIIKYLSYVDYIHLAQINKYFYDLLLIKDNYLFNQFGDLLKYKLFDLKNVPDYLFKLKHLCLFEKANFHVLENFTNLKSLNSSHIPEQYLIRLTNLEKLYSMAGRYLTKHTLLNLKNLKSLTIGWNKQLNDDWVKDLTNLKKLCLFQCPNFKGESLLNLNNITKLILSNCDISGKYFVNLKQLKVLRLRDCNNLLDINFELFNLRKLYIQYCPNITLNLLQNLNQLTKLEIDVTENNINNINKYLKNLISLKYLDININYRNEFDSSCLKYLINLEILIINEICSKFEDEHFCNLGNLKELIIKSIGNSKSNGRFLKYITNLEALDCDVIFESDYYKSLIKLQKLNLGTKNDFKRNITNETIYLQNLRELTIQNLTLNFINNHIQLIHLKFINIDKCELLGNDSLFNYTPNLTFLTLNETNIDDKDLFCLKELKTLIIKKCDGFSGKSFTSFNKLNHLNISQSKNVELGYLRYLSELKKLFLTQIFVKDEDLNELTKLRQLIFYEIDCNLISGKFLLQMNELEDLKINNIYFNKKRREEAKRKINEGVALREILKEFNEDFNL